MSRILANDEESIVTSKVGDVSVMKFSSVVSAGHHELCTNIPLSNEIPQLAFTSSTTGSHLSISSVRISTRIIREHRKLVSMLLKGGVYRIAQVNSIPRP
jgi:hypothetical protein